MASKIMSIAAFAALAMAVPQHAEHMGKSNVERGISYDGSCGSWSGATCPDSQCCSVDGWCGTSTTHCGTGCQAGFGKCEGGAAAPLSSAVASTPAKQSPPPVQSPPAEQSPPAVQSPPSYTAKSSSEAAPPKHTSTPVEAPTHGATTVPVEAPTHGPTTTSPAAVSPTLPAPKSSSSADGKAPGLPGHPAPESSSTTAAAVVNPTTKPTTQLTVSSSIAAPAKPTGGATTGGSKGADAYTFYKGDGSSGAGWPSMDKWVSDFETMWAANLDLIKTGCSTVVGEGQATPAANSDAETATLKQALQDQSKASGVDPRFALAIMMQESKGCVRVHSTNWGVENPGIFQDHDGTGKCNNDKGDAPLNPCPDSQIKQMAKDGIDGTAAGDGLKQVIGSSGSATDSATFYKAARKYNSGSIAASGNLEDGIATHCYSSDVANRLTGWVKAATKCTLGVTK